MKLITQRKVNFQRRLAILQRRDWIDFYFPFFAASFFVVGGTKNLIFFFRLSDYYKLGWHEEQEKEWKWWKDGNNGH